MTNPLAGMEKQKKNRNDSRVEVEPVVVPDHALEETKRTMFLVASGQITEPKLEIEVEGEQQEFRGRDAKIFAFGYLAGLKASKNGVTVDDDTSDIRCGGYGRVGWRYPENRQSPWATCKGCDDCEA